MWQLELFALILRSFGIISCLVLLLLHEWISYRIQEGSSMGKLSLQEYCLSLAHVTNGSSSGKPTNKENLQ